MTDPDLDELVSTLRDHLAATASLAIDPSANRWLGEAEAVAGDLVAGDVDEETIRRRVGHVATLLERMGETESEVADEHVRRARETVTEIEVRLEDGGESASSG